MNFFKKLHKQFNSPQRKELPSFADGTILRYKIRFEGIVQGVGFRYEVYQIATQLKLTGWVRNEMDGSVLCEVQGTNKKIKYLINHLYQVPRFQIDSVIKEELPIKNESSFRMAN